MQDHHVRRRQSERDSNVASRGGKSGLSASRHDTSARHFKKPTPIPTPPLQLDAVARSETAPAAELRSGSGKRGKAVVRRAPV